MSVARVHTVQKSRKAPGKCGRCGKVLEAGDGYLWYTVGFRSHYKSIRCLKASCFPRPSERESSKMATVLAAKESFDDQIDSLTSKDDIEAAVQEVSDAFAEVRDEYQEALDSWEYGNESLQEKVESFDQAASELDGWSSYESDDYDRCDEHQDDDPEQDDNGRPVCEDCGANYDDWLEAMRNEAREAVDSAEAY